MNREIENFPYLHGVEVGRNKNRLGMIWAWERFPRLVELGMGRSERDVLVALMAHTKIGEGNQAWPSQRALMKAAGRGHSTLNAALDNLESARIIHREKRPLPQTTLYRIIPEQDGHIWERIVRKSNSSENGVVKKPNTDSPETGVSIVQKPDTDSPETGHEQVYLTSELKQVKLTSEQQQVNSNKCIAAAAETGKPVQVEQETGKPVRGKQQTVAASRFSPAIRKPKQLPAQPAQLNPEQEAARHLFEVLGEPRNHRSDYQNTWPADLRRLLSKHDLETIKLGISWAIEDSGFWKQWLQRAKNPAAYTVEKFDSWLNQRAEESEQASRKPASQQANRKPEADYGFEYWEP